MKIKFGYKHLPGEHDQQTHTPKGYGTVEQRSERKFRMLRDQASTELKQLWDGKTQPANLRDGSGISKRKVRDTRYTVDDFSIEQSLAYADNILLGATVGGNRMTALEFIDSAYNYVDTETGMQAKVDKIILYSNSVGIVGRIMHKDEPNPVGKFTRTIDKDDGIGNASFTLKPEYQGDGFGTRFYQNSEEVYIYNQIPAVKLDANMEVGGYAWAKMGFDFYYDSQRSQFTYNAKTLWEKQWPEHKQPKFKTAWDIASTMNPDGSSFGKQILLGSQWIGIKYLDPYSTNNASVLNGQAYYNIKSKGKKK